MARLAPPPGITVDNISEQLKTGAGRYPSRYPEADLSILTVKAIARMAVPTTRREIADGLVAGLYLVVQPSGAKSWALRYRLAGRT